MGQEKQKVTIVVEGTPHEWTKDAISYAEVVALEIPGYTPNSGISYSVIHKNNKSSKHTEILSPGASVKVKEGMVFNVSETGQS